MITLGIIGVVAAMTLPVLVQKYNNSITETRLKKFYTVMNQAVLHSISVNGEVSGWEDYYVKDGASNEEIDTAFKKYLAPYLKIVSQENITDYEGHERIVYYFADGSGLVYAVGQNRSLAFLPKNAKKCLKRGNERHGTCNFGFSFYPIVNSAHSSSYLTKKGVEPNMFNWDGRKESLYSGGGDNRGCAESGTYCTALIMYNGWKIPDDYPRKITY